MIKGIEENIIEKEDLILQGQSAYLPFTQNLLLPVSGEEIRMSRKEDFPISWKANGKDSQIGTAQPVNGKLSEITLWLI